MVNIKDVFQFQNEESDIVKKQYLLRTSGIILPITAGSLEEILEMSEEKVHQKILDYMGAQCQEIFVNRNISPKRLRIGITSYGLDRVINFCKEDFEESTDIWNIILQMSMDFLVDYLAIEIDSKCAYSKMLELEPEEKMVKHPESGWHMVKQFGYSFVKITMIDNSHCSMPKTNPKANRKKCNRIKCIPLSCPEIISFSLKEPLNSCHNHYPYTFRKNENGTYLDCNKLAESDCISDIIVTPVKDEYFFSETGEKIEIPEEILVKKNGQILVKFFPY